MSERIVTPSLSFRKDKDRLVIGTFAGALTFTVFSGQGGPVRPSDRYGIADIMTLSGAISKIMAATTGNQLSLTVTRRIDGEFKTAGAVCIGKTDDGIHYIELHSNANGNKAIERFDLVPQTALRQSDKEFNMAEATAHGMASLKWYFDNVLPSALVKSATPPPPRNNRGGGGGGGQS